MSSQDKPLPNCPVCKKDNYDLRLNEKHNMAKDGYVECYCNITCGSVFRFNKYGIICIQDSSVQSRAKHSVIVVDHDYYKGDSKT